MSLRLLPLLLFLALAASLQARSIARIADELGAFDGQITAAAKADQLSTDPDGFLKSKVPHLSPEHVNLIAQVNALRKELFAYFSAQDLKDYIQERVGLERNDDRKNVVLKVAGEPDIVTTLFPRLWVDFIKKIGATEFQLPPPGEVPTAKFEIRSRRPRQAEWDVVEVTPTTSSDAIIRLAREQEHADSCHLAFCLRQATPKEEIDYKSRTSLSHPAFATIIGLQPLVLASAKATELSLTKSSVDLLLRGKSPSLSLLICDSPGFAETIQSTLRNHFATVTLSPRLKHFTTPEQLARELRQDSSTLGLLTLQAAKKLGLHIHPLGVHSSDEAVLPDRESVWCETYPVASPVMMFCNKERPLMAKQFKNYVSRSGQAIIESEGIFPPGTGGSLFGSKPTVPAKDSSELEREYFSLVKDSYRVITPYRIRFQPYRSDVALYSSLNPLALPNLKLLVQNLSLGGWRKGQLVLVGHTDNTANEGVTDPAQRIRDNKKMGLTRAERLALELESLGLPVQQPTAANSMGEELPMADNKDLNRRVELWFTPTSKNR